MSSEPATFRGLQRALLLATSLIPATLVAVFLIGRWPEYWKWIASEDTPMTSLEVGVLYTTALACWGSAATSHLRGLYADRGRWLFLGAGFFWLCLDDRFAIHERIRDGFLAPRGIAIPFLPIAPGDFILLVYMVIGLASLIWLLPLWRAQRQARSHFLAGVGVAVLAVLMDAYDIHGLSLGLQRLEQTVEECLELIAQVLFLQGVLLAWLYAITNPPSDVQGIGGTVAPPGSDAGS